MDCAMNDQTFDKLRDLSRDNLEDLAIQAIIQIRRDKQEKASSLTFQAVLTGFMLGTLVAASGFLAGWAFS
jgi:hypothetical protein